MEVYFTFPDGALGYDCASCGQKCCRGKTFTVDADELIPLIGRAPGVARWLKLAGAGTANALNLTDRCWFLQGSGFCEIEVGHGRAAKPSTCRLFPFNRIAVVRGVRVVDLAGELCPLELRAVDAGGVRYGEITRDIDAAPSSPLVNNPAIEPAGLHDDWLATERAATAIYAQHADPDRAASALGVADSEALVAAWRAFYDVGADVGHHEATAARSIAVLSGSLRYGRLFRTGASYAEELATLPIRVRALTFLAALATEALGETPSLRGLIEIWRGARATLDVLTAWRAPVHVRAPQFGSDVPAPLLPALAQMLGLGFRGGIDLGELLTKLAPSRPVAERPLLIALAHTQLATLLA